MSHYFGIQHILPHFLVHCYVSNHIFLLTPLISPLCLPMCTCGSLIAEKMCLLRTAPFLHMCPPGTHHFHSLHPHSIFPPHLISHYFQPFHLCHQSTLFYYIFQSPSEIHLNNFRTSSSLLSHFRFLHLQMHIHNQSIIGIIHPGANHLAHPLTPTLPITLFMSPCRLLSHTK